MFVNVEHEDDRTFDHLVIHIHFKLFLRLKDEGKRNTKSFSKR